MSIKLWLQNIMFVKSLLSNVVSFRGGRTQFYNGKLIAVPNDTEQEFKYTTNLHVAKSLKKWKWAKMFWSKKMIWPLLSVKPNL